MILLLLIFWSLPFVDSMSASPESECSSKHTKLLLMVDVLHDTNLTIKRLTNIFSYFNKKVEDGIIETLDVRLVDPLQEKTLLNLSHDRLSPDITSVMDQLNGQLNVSGEVNDKRKIPLLYEYVVKVYRAEIRDKTEDKEIILVFLFSCPGSCSEFQRLNLYVFENTGGYRLKIIPLLEVPPKIDPKIYAKNYFNSYESVKLPVIFIDSKDDFKVYNPVTFDHCGDCPEGWIRYTWLDNRSSCYQIDVLDTSISWLNASRMCESFKSSLPAFEEEEELIFVKDILMKEINSKLTNKTLIVNIGLLKKPGIRQNQYMWWNLRPFNLQARFDNSQYDGEHCVAVTFSNAARYQTDEIKWNTVKCDEAISSVLVCELEGRKIENLENSYIKHYIESMEYSTNEDGVMFYCQDEYNDRIPYGSVCDRSRDCSNGRDEQYCNFQPSKEENNFFCINPNGVGNYPTRTSVPIESRCNFIQDCPDNSDEHGCDGCLGKRCQDGTCVPGHWLSRDGEQCDLYIGTKRNLVLNMSDAYEISFCNSSIRVEQIFKANTAYKILKQVVEWAPKCLYLRGSDRNPTGCQNKHHLRDCGTFKCPEGFFKCPESYCLPVYNVMDGVLDCPYGQDETVDFLEIYDSRVLECKKSNRLIHPLNICDGVPQCEYGEDEMMCPVICPPGFKCVSQAVNVNNQTLVGELKSLNIFDISTKFFNLSGLDLSKLKEKVILPNLFEIHASNCNLVDPDQLLYIDYENKNLYHLNLSHNKIEEVVDFGAIAILNNLHALSLSHNTRLIKIGKYSVLSQKLHALDLSFTSISVLNMYVLDQKTSIRFLNLFKTNIVQIGSLQKIKRLEFLNLQQTSLSAETTIQILENISVSSALYVDNFRYCCPQISKGGTPQHACHAPPEAFSSCEDLLSDVLKRSLLWLVACVSLAGNVIVISYRLLYDRDVSKKSYGVFLINLTVSDFIMGVYLVIIASTDVHYRDKYVLHESDWRQSFLCQAAGFLSTLSCETSTFFVFLITLDRCLVIRFPFGDHRFRKWALILTVISTWVIGFILALISVLHPSWRIYSYNGMCLGLPLTFGPYLAWHYSFAIFICVNFVIFIFIACGQMFIVRLIWTGHKFQMTEAQSVARRIQDINATKQLFLVALSNFLCWFPICILGFLTLAGGEVSQNSYAWLVVFVMPVNAAVNPMIYTLPVIYGKWQDFKKGNITRQ